VHIDVRHLRLIAAIADTGGVTRAARRLNLTQSALSHQLRDVESRLGVALFLRVNKRMVITDAGERLLATARRVLAELEVAERELASGEYAEGTGTIRLATECYTCYHWLPAALATFRAGWPRVELRIVPEATPRPIAALLEGELDVAIVSTTSEHARLRLTPLFDDELVVVTHPQHRLAALPFVTAQDFAPEHVLLYLSPHSESTLLRDVLRPAGVEPRGLSRVLLTEAIVELVKADLGVSVLARWAVAPHVRAGTLAAVPLTEGGFHRRWSAATRADPAEPPFLADFLALLTRDVFGGPAVTRPRRLA
jgi:LysR family transcriptional regulator, regulator for metE and metH